jgi:dethiobiotin synthetase/adenosylmethionine--8-amino-7-oxononanoate aminotransferase
VIFDEVFTGMYRLGRATASSFLGLHPDISVHAKLLTGGLVPLCTTLASECIFDAFASDDKSDALLHGHSYTAHPVGCQVAVESLSQMQAMERGGEWDWAKGNGWQPNHTSTTAASKRPTEVWSIWSMTLVEWLSSQTDVVAGVWALGSVLAVHLNASDGRGYVSTAAEGLRKRLLCSTGSSSVSGEGTWNVHARVLGNVLYIMGCQRTTELEVEEISDVLRVALKG